MTFPAFVFGSICALLIGSLFHLLLGGNFKHLVLYLIVSWVGFWIGNYAGEQLSFQLFEVGLIDLGVASIGSLVLLGIVYWLGMDTAENVHNKQKR